MDDENSKPTISRNQARAALACIEGAIAEIMPAVHAAPHLVGARAAGALTGIVESVAAELGVEILGDCEGCLTKIFNGDDHIFTRDGCWLCTECRPSDEDLARIRSIQAACPAGDPECEAQTADDHERCGAL